MKPMNRQEAIKKIDQLINGIDPDKYPDIHIRIVQKGEPEPVILDTKSIYIIIKRV